MKIALIILAITCIIGLALSLYIDLNNENSNEFVIAVDPETGVHYLLYDTGGSRGGTAITVMYDNDGRIKHDK